MQRFADNLYGGIYPPPYRINFGGDFVLRKIVFSIITAAVVSVMIPLAVNASSSANIVSNNGTDWAEENKPSAGGWCYYSYDVDNGLSKSFIYLTKGNGGRFAEDEYAVDLNKTVHIWYVKKGGKFASDTRAIVWNYTVNDSMENAPKGINIRASLPASSHFQILTTSDNSVEDITGDTKIVYDETKTTHSVDVTLPKGTLKTGDDILFVIRKTSASSYTTMIQTDFNVKAMYVDQVAQPVFITNETVVKNGEKITITSETPGADIYYTTDGSDPQTSETKKKYTEPVTITENTDLKAYAVKTDREDSYVTSKHYIIDYPIRDFSAVCNATIASEYTNDTLGWLRFDCTWSSYETAPGVYSETFFDSLGEKVLKAKEQGYTPLLILGYGPTWYTEQNGYTFTHKLTGDVYEYGPVGEVDINGTIKTGLHKKVTNRWGEVLTDTNTSLNNKYQMSADSVDEWQDFVRKTLDVFTAEPYNLEYFQIWNEAYPSSSFYYGDLDQYMQVVHNPAAQVMREYPQVKIVYGGWPCCGPMSEFIDVIDRNDAWQYVDVLDVHYTPLDGMDYLYRAAKERGVEKPFVWQTEMGFTTDGGYPANMYARTLRWGLEHGLFSEDENGSIDRNSVKLFWFSSGSPDDPKAYGWNCSLMAGTRITDNGKSVFTFNNNLVANKIEKFNNYQTTPYLRPEVTEMLSASEGFRLDNNSVLIAVHLIKENNYSSAVSDVNGTGEAMDISDPAAKVTIDVKGVKGNINVKRIDQFGNETPIEYSYAEDGTLQVQVPVAEADEYTAEAIAKSYCSNFYLRIESDEEIGQGDWTTPSYE